MKKEKGVVNLPLILLGSLTLLAITVGLVLYFVSLNSGNHVSNSNDNGDRETHSSGENNTSGIDYNKDENVPTTDSNGINSDSETPQNSDKEIDCEEDKDCFVSASKDCKKAKVNWEEIFNEEGMVTNSITFMELKGIENNKCVFYRKIFFANVSFDEGALKGKGLSEEEITETKNQALLGVRSMIGLEKTCNIETEVLFETLKKWKEGNYSREDEKNWRCDSDSF